MAKESRYQRFERLGPEKVRHAVATGRFAGRNLVEAKAWLEQKDRTQAQEAVARGEHHKASELDAARQAADAASSSARAAKRSEDAAERQTKIATRANLIAFFALGVAVLSLLISLFR
jgi:hypothetical protein